MSIVDGKTVLVVVAGGIAAYKALELVRRLRERGARVIPVMTEAAKSFVTPLALASLAGEQVHDTLFSLTDEAAMGHIELSRLADLLVVAPATVNLLAKMANGMADDLASTLLLATDKKTLVAPAMNLRMWLHPATQRNVATLRGDGVLFCGPDEGAMACGEFGPGRMSEPLAIVAAIEEALMSDTRLPLPDRLTSPVQEADAPLAGHRVVVTSGPTHEPLDPVRFIANRSSGKQGHAIAAAARRAGADVVLVTGPVAEPDPAGVRVVKVETAQQMLDAVEMLPADVLISAAAVADWRLAAPLEHKLKKGEEQTANLQLVANPDILATVAARGARRPRLVIGFAAETQDLLANAKRKLAAKGCDLIVLNDVGPQSGVFGSDRNRVILVDADRTVEWPEMTKQEVAIRLVRLCAERLSGTAP